jgi:DNA-binding Lrp family transcriptional regulator
MDMRLTKNEKITISLLLENARISDSAIASKLHISSQAVGKIRRKLEKSLIKSYTLELDYPKLGIKTFAIALAKLTPEGLNKGELEIERKLLQEENIIQIFRLPNGESTHCIFYGFKDINELDEFFHSPQKMKEIHKYIETKEMFTFSHNSLIKASPSSLIKKTIENLSNSNSEFKEIQNFKKRIG